MRPRRSNATSVRTALIVLAVLATGGSIPRATLAQGIAQAEGAVFLLAPIGGRAVGQGQAVVASSGGAEGLWWNPASLGWVTRTELSLAGSTTIDFTGLSANLTVPAGRAGVLSGAAYVLDFGEQPATDLFQNTTGRILPRGLVLAASYAATFGKDVTAGLTYKFVQQRFDCDGECGNAATGSVSTTAFDFGVQVFADHDHRLSFGAALRNLGFALQVNDNDQADRLPTRLSVGAQYRVGSFERVAKDGTLTLSAEIVGSPSLDDASNPLSYLRDHGRIGAQFAWRDLVFIRGGYAGGDADTDGPAFGIGFKRGAISIGFAQVVGGLSSEAGKPPSYFTLSFGF